MAKSRVNGPSLLDLLQFRLQLSIDAKQVPLSPTMASHVEKVDKLISAELDRLLGSTASGKEGKRPRGRPPKATTPIKVFNPNDRWMDEVSNGRGPGQR